MSARLAQLVEHLTCKQGVAGSSYIGHTFSSLAYFNGDEVNW